MKKSKLKIKNLLFCLTFIFLFFAAYLYAGDEGTATGVFLRMEQGAKPIGMGGAFVGIADNADGIYYNPAGIAQLERKEFSLTYSLLYEDISSSFLSFVLPTEKIGSFGVGVTYLNVAKIEKTDTSGNSLGDTSIYNLAAALYYAKKIGMFSLGGGVKFIQQDYDAAKGTGLAVDAGLLLQVIKDKLSAGLSVVNAGPQAKVGDWKNKLPMNIRGGVGYKPINGLTLGVDLEKPVDRDMKLHIGGEYQVSSMFAIRLGYQPMKNLGGNAGLTAGIGIRTEVGKERLSWGLTEAVENLPVFCFDYTYVSYGELKNTHRVSAGLRF